MHSNICEQYYINQVLQHGGSNILRDLTSREGMA